MGLEAVFLVLQTDFFSNFSAMKFNGPDRQTHYLRDLFCFFALPDKAGDLDLLRGKSVFDRSKIAGKRRYVRAGSGHSKIFQFYSKSSNSQVLLGPSPPLLENR